ncbi:MAG: hypothetical protein IPJ32_16560 [Sphingobacteriaceae bacterium]|nr:hypothetical protein [Sphingobacteriaceae bacterium]
MLRSIALASVLTVFLISCTGDKKETDGISTNEVNNTASADGSKREFA